VEDMKVVPKTFKLYNGFGLYAVNNSMHLQSRYISNRLIRSDARIIC
jgi:hypothetical protein